MTHYETFLKARYKAVRAAGKHIVATLEAGADVRPILTANQYVQGLDITAGAAVNFSGVSRERRIAAFRALRQMRLDAAGVSA